MSRVLRVGRQLRRLSAVSHAQLVAAKMSRVLRVGRQLRRLSSSPPETGSRRFMACMDLDILQIPVRTDNYTYAVLHKPSDTRLVVDPSEGEPVVRAIRELLGWEDGVDIVLNTHWHDDHTAGNGAVKALGSRATVVVGPKGSTIAGLDVEVDGSSPGGLLMMKDGTAIRILDCPGHTVDHKAFYLEESSALFSGDVIFPMGCGRLFEGTPTQMHASLSQIAALPRDVWIFAAHEYTVSNAAFALTVDPHNKQLRERAAAATTFRDQGLPTVPSQIGDELDTNPFLRSHCGAIRHAVALDDSSSDAEVFAAVRRRKDEF